MSPAPRVVRAFNDLDALAIIPRTVAHPPKRYRTSIGVFMAEAFGGIDPKLQDVEQNRKRFADAQAQWKSLSDEQKQVIRFVL